MSKFHSVVTANLPSSGTVGDIYYTTDRQLIYAVVGDGSLVQLLISTPIPVQGPIGPTGLTGATGEAFASTIQFSGNWLPSPQTYIAGEVVSFNGFLYLSIAALNVSTNVSPPASNPFWTLAGPSTFSGRQSAIVVIIDGDGLPPSLGSKGYIQIPFACTVSSYSIIADQSGSAQLDVLWSSFAGLPNTTSIVGSTPPILDSQQTNEANIAASWTPNSFDAGDVLEVRLASVSTVTRLTFSVTLVAT